MAVPRSEARPRWRILALALLLAAAIVAVDLLWLAPGGTRPTREGGGIETATAMLYVFAALTWLRFNPPEVWRRCWHIPLVLLMMAGREFDLDVALTSQGILTSAMYFTDRAPVWERLFGLAVVILLGVIAYRLIAFHGRDMVRGLRERRLGAWATLLAVATAAVAINIDGLGRKLRPLGIDLSPETVAGAGAAEEVIELFIPILLLVAILDADRWRAAAPHVGRA